MAQFWLNYEVTWHLTSKKGLLKKGIPQPNKKTDFKPFRLVNNDSHRWLTSADMTSYSLFASPHGGSPARRLFCRSPGGERSSKYGKCFVRMDWREQESWACRNLFLISNLLRFVVSNPILLSVSMFFFVVFHFSESQPWCWSDLFLSLKVLKRFGLTIDPNTLPQEFTNYTSLPSWRLRFVC